MRALLELKNASQATPRDAEVYYRLGVAYASLTDI
jgi:hypothetical protein